MRKALVDATGKVINVIEIEEGSNWKPPAGCYLLNEEVSQQANIGDMWDGKTLIKVEPIPVEPVRDLAAEIDMLKTRITKLEKM